MASTTSDGLMRWSHFSSSKRSVDLDEPIYLNLFTVSINASDMPPGLGFVDDDVNIVLEGLRTVGGLDTQPGVGSVKQEYKFAERGFAGARPSKTHLELQMNFELNLRRNGTTDDNYTYKFWRKWSDLIYDPLTGHMSIKKNYICRAMTITMQDKEGVAFHQWQCYNCFPMDPIQAPNLDYGSTSIWQNFPVKLWVDTFDESIC